MADRDCSELRALLAKATEGPWRAVPADDYEIAAAAYPTSYPHRFPGDDTGSALAVFGNRPADFGEANRNLVVAAVNALPALLDEIEVLRAFFRAVDEMTTRWAGTDKLAGIYPSHSNEIDGDEEQADWDRFVEAHAAVRALRLSQSPTKGAVSEWRNIATAPKDGTSILIWKPGERMVGEYMMAAYWDDQHFSGEPGWVPVGGNNRQGYTSEVTGTQQGYPTRWMPLPPDPFRSGRRVVSDLEKLRRKLAGDVDSSVGPYAAEILRLLPVRRHREIDGNDIWETLFGIMKGNVPDEITEDVCAQLADALRYDGEG
jgi:hypothetical protein